MLSVLATNIEGGCDEKKTDRFLTIRDTLKPLCKGRRRAATGRNYRRAQSSVARRRAASSSKVGNRTAVRLRATPLRQAMALSGLGFVELATRHARCLEPD